MSRKRPYLYLAYAIPLMLLTARITPPFQVPDEPNHFYRAEQVSSWRWITRPLRSVLCALIGRYYL